MESLAWECSQSVTNCRRSGIRSGPRREWPGATKIAESGSRIWDLYHCQSNIHSELRRSLPARRDHLDRLRRVSHQSSREQAHGEETADAVDRPRCPSFTASADPRFE